MCCRHRDIMAMFVVDRRKRGTQECTPRPHRWRAGGSVQNLSLSSRSRAHSVDDSPQMSRFSQSCNSRGKGGSHSSSSQQGTCVQATWATFAQILPSHAPVASAVHGSMHGREYWWAQKAKKCSRYTTRKRHPTKSARGISAAMSRCSSGWAWNGDKSVSREHMSDARVWLS